MEDDRFGGDDGFYGDESPLSPLGEGEYWSDHDSQ
jgi:hypothetical protein